jgi:hypothetical protein
LVEVNRRYCQYAVFKAARSPKEAPILHFGGPLEMVLLGVAPAPMAGKEFEVRVAIGTRSRTGHLAMVRHDRKLQSAADGEEPGGRCASAGGVPATASGSVNRPVTADVFIKHGQVSPTKEKEERLQMPPREDDAAARAYYADRYDVVCEYGFVTKPPIRLNDHNPKCQTARRGRFCRRGTDTMTFAKKAHAVSELLGNKTIRSMNECDDCNTYFATEFEVHLGNWSQFPRSVAQVKGKGGAPAYENPSETMRLSNDGGKLSIFLTDKSLFEKAKAADGPFAFDLPSDAPSPKFVPFRAAKALVKCACSICPLEDLPQCRRAIDWLMTGKGLSISNFPILIGFTPGPPTAFTSKAWLLRRKGPGHEPYLWCVIQYLNYRLQFLVPGCPIDAPIFAGGRTTIPARHFRPAEIPFDWPLGETEYYLDDWSSEVERESSVKVGFHVLKAWVVSEPTAPS